MSLLIRTAGLQTTIQGKIRSGYRHFGVPWSGPADPLSFALANRLVSNTLQAPALETALNGVCLEFDEPLVFAVTGAQARIQLNESEILSHKSYRARKGDVLKLHPPGHGCRNYIAFSGHLDVDPLLGSVSTYLAGSFGGLHGRSLQNGDRLSFKDVFFPPVTETPPAFRPLFNDRMILQVVEGPDFVKLKTTDVLFDHAFTATARMSRMGVQISGPTLEMEQTERMESAAVFPGAVQCPPDGNPFLLLPDSQTTGGYPHILQVIRGDRFQLGQIRQGTIIRFVKRTSAYAVESFRARWRAYKDWLNDPVL